MESSCVMFKYSEPSQYFFLISEKHWVGGFTESLGSIPTHMNDCYSHNRTLREKNGLTSYNNFEVKKLNNLRKTDQQFS